jgi:hypothetical protein
MQWEKAKEESQILAFRSDLVPMLLSELAFFIIIIIIIISGCSGVAGQFL